MEEHIQVSRNNSIKLYCLNVCGSRYRYKFQAFISTTRTTSFINHINAPKQNNFDNRVQNSYKKRISKFSNIITFQIVDNSQSNSNNFIGIYNIFPHQYKNMKLPLRKKVFVFGVILVRIFPHSDCRIEYGEIGSSKNLFNTEEKFLALIVDQSSYFQEEDKQI